ncbi:MAG: elongation factor 1-beta [Candidatus Atabeyarchaeum deiterrae]
MARCNMTKVLAVVKVMPESADTSMDDLQQAIADKLPSKVSIRKSEIEEIAFGIKALRLNLVLPDDSGGTDLVEETIRGVKGVSDVQVEFVSRL